MGLGHCPYTPAFQVPNLVSLLAALVADLSMVEHAGPVRGTLAPFSGHYSFEHGFGAEMPLDATLGRLAFLQGDLAAAEHHLQIALSFACSMRSPVLEANCLWYLAQTQHASGAVKLANERIAKPPHWRPVHASCCPAKPQPALPPQTLQHGRP